MLGYWSLHLLAAGVAEREDDVVQLWGNARGLVAEVILEGIARAGAKGLCTPMGRSAMSLDLQVHPLLPNMGCLYELGLPAPKHCKRSQPRPNFLTEDAEGLSVVTCPACSCKVWKLDLLSALP